MSTVFSDDFTSDTSADYSSIGTATSSYDAANNQLDVTCVDSFTGVARAAIPVSVGSEYTVTANMTNLDPAGGISAQVEITAGTTLAGHQYGSSNRINHDSTGDATLTLTATSTDLYITARCRSVTDFTVNSITVTGPTLTPTLGTITTTAVTSNSISFSLPVTY